MDNLLKSDVIKSQIYQEFKDIIQDINSYEIEISPQYNEENKLEKVNYSIVNAYSAKSAHPFRKNGAPFRLKLSNAQLVN